MKKFWCIYFQVKESAFNDLCRYDKVMYAAYNDAVIVAKDAATQTTDYRYYVMECRAVVEFVHVQVTELE